MKILLTGASGFLGSALTMHLNQKNYPLAVVVRRFDKRFPLTIEQHVIDDFLSKTEWEPICSQVNTIIHLAARAHILKDKATNPLALFRETNTYATLTFARQAAHAGVRRFVFISSIGVNGNQTLDKAFTTNSIPNPTTYYAISKHEAEIGLKQIASETNMEIVIIRPPLVYGANAPGNFGQLIKAIIYGIPLPLGSIYNKRSLVALSNLIDLITVCITHPNAANQTLLVSDNNDLSTTQLLQQLSIALNKPTRLLPIPQKFLETCLNLLGKNNIAQSLCGNLQIDISKTQELLNWIPPVSVYTALHETAQSYLKQDYII